MTKKILLFLSALSLVCVFGNASAIQCYGRYQRHTSRRKVCRTIPGRTTYRWRYQKKLVGYKYKRKCSKSGYKPYYKTVCTKAKCRKVRYYRKSSPYYKTKCYTYRGKRRCRKIRYYRKSTPYYKTKCYKARCYKKRFYRSTGRKCRTVKVPNYRRVRTRYAVPGKAKQNCRWVYKSCCWDPRSRKKRSCF